MIGMENGAPLQGDDGDVDIIWIARTVQAAGGRKTGAIAAHHLAADEPEPRLFGVVKGSTGQSGDRGELRATRVICQRPRGKIRNKNILSDIKPWSTPV